MHLLKTSLLLVFSFSLSKQDLIRVPSIAINNNQECPSTSAIDAAKNVTSKYFSLFTCGSSAGWTLVSRLNMSDLSQNCPANWSMNENPVRGCGRRSQLGKTCDSVLLPVNNKVYSSVCGRIIAYQVGPSPAFLYSLRDNLRATLEDPYVSGISLTHGQVGSRQHIWTFVGANGREIHPNNQWFYCFCTNINFTWPYQVPSFVNNDYFCENGNNNSLAEDRKFYLNDSLWDGNGCSSSSSCCQLNSPPWFSRDLQYSTSDDLELRLCSYNDYHEEDKLITLIELYVK